MSNLKPSGINSKETHAGGHWIRTCEALGLALPHLQTPSWSFCAEGRWRGRKEGWGSVPALSWRVSQCTAAVREFSGCCCVRQNRRSSSLVALWTCGADSDNSSSLSANAEPPWQPAERRPRVPLLGLVYSDWNCTPVPWDLTLFMEFSERSKGAEVRFLAETSEPSCSLKHPLLPSLLKPAASAPSSPSQK